MLQIQEVCQTVYPAIKPEGHTKLTTESVVAKLHALREQRIPVLAGNKVPGNNFCTALLPEPLSVVVTYYNPMATASHLVAATS